MASHNIPSFVNLRDAFNSTTASQSARSNGQHPRLSQGATTTLAAGPSSASAPPRPNPVNPDGHTNAHPNLIPPGSPVTREALLAAIQSISQSKQLNVPVGTQEDDGLLVRTLYESDENGQTFRQALENLNGVCDTSSMCLVSSQCLIIEISRCTDTLQPNGGTTSSTTVGAYSSY